MDGECVLKFLPNAESKEVSMYADPAIRNR